MKRNEIWQAVAQRLKEDKSKSKSFPDHPAGMAGKVVVPAGGLMKLCMHIKYKQYEASEAMKNNLKKAAIEVIVQAIRFLENLK